MVEIQPVNEERNVNMPTSDQSKLQRILVIILGATILMMLGLGWYIFDVMNSKIEKFESFTKVSLQGESTADVDVEDKKEGTLNLSNTDPEVSSVVEKISKHILLPTGEITVATVNDADRLRQENPKTFQYVKNGDRLLISSSSIIIYDPEVDKVVDVAH